MSDQELPAIQMLVLERVDASRKMSRYYVLAITPTMFGEPALAREWGRIARSVRRSIELHADDAMAAEALNCWLQRKTKRGYLIAYQG